MLAASQLECRRGDRRLFSDLDFLVAEGRLLHVLGPNGAGKTTLLRSLCGLFQPDAGTITWRGRDIREDREAFRRETLFFGHLNGLKGDLDGVENLRIATVLAGQRLRDSALWDALAGMGLAGFEDLPVRVLSQGQQKRVALARLLLTDARLWILDEPFTALDVESVSFLQERIAGHVDAGGIAVLTTHQAFPFTEDRVQRLTLEAA